MNETVSNHVYQGDEGGLLPAQLRYLDLHQDDERKSGEMGQGLLSVRHDMSRGGEGTSLPCLSCCPAAHR